MKKSLIIGSALLGLTVLGTITGALGQHQITTSNTTDLISNGSSTKTVEKITPVCDGTIVTKNCAIEGVNYSAYIYHSAVIEKSHDETTTTYDQAISSYCTLCNDGTYSPSCATGRGACSNHEGVAQWNAPRYSSIPVYNTKNVIDTPAQEPYYEKIVQ